MILAVDDVMKLPEFAVQNEKVIEEKLNAAELMIRAYTNNNFQNRFVRFTADSLGNRLLRTSDFLKVGDTVQISQSMVNDGLYTITEIGDDFIRVNQELYKSTNLITKVEYPADIRAGVLELLKWDIKNRPKTGSSLKRCQDTVQLTLIRMLTIRLWAILLPYLILKALYKG